MVMSSVWWKGVQRWHAHTQMFHRESAAPSVLVSTDGKLYNSDVESFSDALHLSPLNKLMDTVNRYL